MANVGTAAAGKTLIGAGNGASPTFASIGTNSGLTAHGIVLAEGNNAFSVSNAGINGQLLIASTGNDPAFATLTSSDGSIAFTTGPNSLSLRVVGGTTVGKTITGDSGGALSPTSGNWNILGKSGSKTSGSGSTLTVKSPPYSDVSSSATSSLNTGEFVTGAYTRTLPASVGLEDGDLFEYVCTTASALVIQAVGSQKIRIGNVISSAAGTITSTSIGDSISLRFRATDGFFYATSVVGTWIVA